MPRKSEAKRRKTNCEAERKFVIKESSDGFEKYALFYGNTSAFSNFRPSVFTINDIEFNTTEQYFHYMKAVHFKDTEIAERLLESDSPLEQKRLGRSVKNYEEKEWNRVCARYMKEGCLAKFEQNKELRDDLFETIGTTLVEASPRDRKWGIGLGMTNPDAVNRELWKGSNLLGQILTEIRDEMMKRPEYATEIKESDKTVHEETGNSSSNQ